METREALWPDWNWNKVQGFIFLTETFTIPRRLAISTISYPRSFDPIDPYEGIVVAKPITPTPARPCEPWCSDFRSEVQSPDEDGECGYHATRPREGFVRSMTFGKARINWRWRSDMLSLEGGW